MTHRVLSDNQFTELTNTFSHGYAGGTRNVHTNEHHPVGTTGFVVALQGPHESTHPGPAVVSHVTAHRQAMLADPKVQADKLATQGSWHVHPELGAAPALKEAVTYDRGTLLPFDRSQTAGNEARSNVRARAVRLGRRNGQRAVFDLEHGEDVNLPGEKMHQGLMKDLELAKTRPARGADWIGGRSGVR